MDTEIRLEARDLNQQASMLIKANNFDAASVKLDMAIEIDPMLAESYRNYGDLEMARSNYRDAKGYYKKAILIEKNGLYYFLYGNACFMNDDVHEGLENYNLAISAGYDNDEMMFFMGMAYEHLNDDSMALRYFHKACVKNPSRPDYQVKKIGVLIRLDMMDNAEECTDELLKNSPELYDGYHIKTQILINKGETEEAVRFAKEASDRFPEDSELMYDYAKSTALAKDYSGALKLIDTAKQMKYFEDAKRDFIILEAEISAENNDIERAVKCCNDCIEMEGEGEIDGEARFMLMNLHLVKPSFSESLEQAKALVAGHKEDVYYFAALYYRAFCTKQIGNLEEANAYYREANSLYRLETLKNPSAVDVYMYRAMCLKDMEEYDKALDILDFILGITPDIAEVHTLKADIFKSLGQNLRAEEELNLAYAIKPELKDMLPKEGEQ